ncbi:MAG TPA: hypothetical protein VD768_00700 [Sphingomicrobium sp.]|nr:hypothetical protein [Sphingomicrobium sp.]
MALAALGLSGTATAQKAEIGYPKGSLGFEAIMKSDLAAAERQLRESALSKYDAGRALNLGYVLAKTGRTEQASRQFVRVLREDEVELILADDTSLSSHVAARRALAALAKTR